jgi:hypothetical protein
VVVLVASLVLVCEGSDGDVRPGYRWCFFLSPFWLSSSCFFIHAKCPVFSLSVFFIVACCMGNEF